MAAKRENDPFLKIVALALILLLAISVLAILTFLT